MIRVFCLGDSLAGDTIVSFCMRTCSKLGIEVSAEQEGSAHFSASPIAHRRMAGLSYSRQRSKRNVESGAVVQLFALFIAASRHENEGSRFLWFDPLDIPLSPRLRPSPPSCLNLPVISHGSPPYDSRISPGPGPRLCQFCCIRTGHAKPSRPSDAGAKRPD